MGVKRVGASMGIEAVIRTFKPPRSQAVVVKVEVLSHTTEIKGWTRESKYWSFP